MWEGGEPGSGFLSAGRVFQADQMVADVGGRMDPAEIALGQVAPQGDLIAMGVGMDLPSHALWMRGSGASSKRLPMGSTGADPALPVTRPGGETGVRPTVAVRGVPVLGAGQRHQGLHCGHSPRWVDDMQGGHPVALLVAGVGAGSLDCHKQELGSGSAECLGANQNVFGRRIYFADPVRSP